MMRRLHSIRTAAASIVLSITLNAATEPVSAEQGIALPTSGSVGAIRRNEAGEIVPADGKPAPADDSRPRTPLTGVSPLSPILVSYTPDRARRNRLVRRLQRDIDRILADAKQYRAYGAATDSLGLTLPEQALRDELRRRDAAVRRHEQQHFYTGRPYTIAPEYWYVTGPLGQRFAVAGVVRLDLRSIPGGREANIRKLEILKRAALAPLKPSPEDRALAQKTDRAIQQLRRRPP